MEKLTSFFCTLALLITLIGCSANSTRLTIETGDSLQFTHPKRIHYSNYWEAMKNLALSDTSLFASNNEYQEFTRGLQAVVAGNIPRAEQIFDHRYRASVDSAVAGNSKKILANLFFGDSDWPALLALDVPRKPGQSPDNNNRLLIQAFRDAPPEVYKFFADSFRLPLSVSASGSPVVTVEINGRMKNFWIDTGAGLSVVSSDVAEECGILPRNQGKATAGTATSKRVDIQPAVIDSIKIGALTIKHHPAIIIDKKDLEFKLLGFIKIMKIDGILGWNAIRNVVLTLDYQGKQAIFQKPSRKVNRSNNFFWLGYPLVILRSEEGVPLCFGLDTGARRSSVTSAIFNKISVTGVKSKNERVGGAGGFEKMEVEQVPKLSIFLNSTRFTFENIKIMQPPGAIFFNVDGVLGGDVLKNSTVIIDYQNGRFVHRSNLLQ